LVLRVAQKYFAELQMSAVQTFQVKKVAHGDKQFAQSLHDDAPALRGDDTKFVHRFDFCYKFTDNKRIAQTQNRKRTQNIFLHLRHRLN
jgi:hypothetical protein